VLYFSHAHEHSFDLEVGCSTLVRPWTWNAISFDFSLFKETTHQAEKKELSGNHDVVELDAE
jgi:hypothetical protein